MCYHGSKTEEWEEIFASNDSFSGNKFNYFGLKWTLNDAWKNIGSKERSNKHLSIRQRFGRSIMTFIKAASKTYKLIIQTR